jgi:hypothetical protein
MNNYKKYLIQNIIFILGEINFILYHIKTLNLNDKYKNKIIVIENEIDNLLNDLNLNNDIFQGDEKDE